MKAKIVCEAGTSLLLMLCASPLYAKHLAAPTWDVTVVNADGDPLPNISVAETWQDYSCEHESHTVTLRTDERGQVHFPAVHVRRNVAACAKETASELAAGVHASLGRHVYVTVSPDVKGVVCVSDKDGNCVD